MSPATGTTPKKPKYLRRLSGRQIAMGVAAPLVAVGLLATGAAAWQSHDVSARLVGDRTVQFTGVFPTAPATAPVYRVSPWKPRVNDVTLDHFGFPRGLVTVHRSGGTRTYATTNVPDRSPYRVDVGTSSGYTWIVARAQAPTSRTTPSPGPVPQKAQHQAAHATSALLDALGYDHTRWVVTPPRTEGPSGAVNVTLAERTPAGKQSALAVPSGTVTFHDGHLTAVGLHAFRFTDPHSVSVLSAQEAWDRYAHHRDEVTPATAASSRFTSVTFGFAGLGHGSAADIRVEPVWVFRAPNQSTLLLCADASAPAAALDIPAPLVE